jgi:CheY-like chemotaxis protein
MNGYQLAVRLRRLPGMEHARLIAITGHGQAEDRPRALQAGFDVHLLKPVSPDELAELLSA